MSRHTDILTATLESRGVMSAPEIAQALRVSQPTVSRAIASVSRQKMLTIGKGKSTRYAIRRQVRGSDSDWPLYNITASGDIELSGRLYALEPRQWYLEQEAPWDSLRGREFPAGLYPDLPWFLQDLRPQGFLGRAFACRYAAEIGAPTDPRKWSSDDIIIALTRYGADLPGSFIIGDEMLSLFQRQTHDTTGIIEYSERSHVYPSLAEDIIHAGLPGSSAAGEQPKFTTCIRNPDNNTCHVIVKFTGSAGRPEDQRWNDLLIAENLANRILTANGIPCAETTILHSEGRTFLESQRFDRIGHYGRRGLISLESLDSAFFGEIDSPWTEAARRLAADGWSSDQDTEVLQLLWWFGTLIGNTDMHYGNASFLLSPNQPLELAPVYDMVPMLYRPNQEGGLPDTIIEPQPPSPIDRDACSRAANLAEEYWQLLATEQGLSDTFKIIAEHNTQAVSAYRRQYKLG